MHTPSARVRAVLLLVCLPLAALVGGSGIGCPAVDVVLPPDDEVAVVHDPPDVVVVADAFGIDLINNASFSVDPGVWVDEFRLGLRTLAPLEGSDVPVPFDIDCLPDDTLTIDPILFLSPVAQANAANAPLVLHEGIDYFCGDVLTLLFSQDGNGTFFVDVAVNGEYITF